MRRVPKKKKEEGGAPSWMVTYSDLVTLVLVFFVLLYSFSIIDIIKFQQFVASFQGAGILHLGPQPLESPPEPETQDNILQDKTVQDMQEKPEQDGRVHMGELQDVIEENPLVEVYISVTNYIAENDLQEVVEVRFEKRGIALEIKDRILFDSARADLKPNAREVLKKLAPLLQELPYMTSVEGHTDDRPINTRQFPSNWELSVARALSVVRYFIDDLNMEPKRFAIVGLGEYHPIAANDSPENLQLNRRVIIVINAEDPFKSEVLSDGRTETESN
ncbi:flagellar motor protein MotB [Desulfitibacter alkalitolerans]|uniref:flagellar motor protein MotB n=1 Tax=Desulfitibacter alkalitolerans TaxID=264641 RepID=UPI000488EF93|nr:flagellar motor protein MotB [Desulfitibacter alkalitolerans]